MHLLQCSIVQIPIDAVGGTIMGIYNTTVGGDSLPATPGRGVGRYLDTHPPSNACDNDIETAYQSFGWCPLFSLNLPPGCGHNTGLYFELKSGPTLIIGLRICRQHHVARDPDIVSLEGSNQSGINLTLGASWTLIYQGSTEFDNYQPIAKCSANITFDNTVRYSSYRFLVLKTDTDTDMAEYSEVQLYTNTLA